MKDDECEVLESPYDIHNLWNEEAPKVLRFFWIWLSWAQIVNCVNKKVYELEPDQKQQLWEFCAICIERGHDIFDINLGDMIFSFDQKQLRIGSNFFDLPKEANDNEDKVSLFSFLVEDYSYAYEYESFDSFSRYTQKLFEMKFLLVQVFNLKSIGDYDMTDNDRKALLFYNNYCQDVGLEPFKINFDMK